MSYNQCGCNHWTTPKCPANKCPWQGLRPVDRALKAEAAPIVPQGWKLVPMEPTPEMVQAYLNANNAYWVRVDEAPPIIGEWRNGTPSEATAESYRAMLAASPAPDADGVETNDGGQKNG